MRYIERDLPIEHLNTLAWREGNSKKPIYRMHKWWARRLGSVFRMLILAAFADADTGVTELWDRFYHGHGNTLWCSPGGDPEGRVILDPFMGGGTTLVEGLRLGCKVVGVDINPVAWFITKKEIEPVDLTLLDHEFSRLEATVGADIRRLYRTTCQDGHMAEIMYAFWIKTIPCAQCGVEVELWPNAWVSRRKEREFVVCPRCHLIFAVAPRSRAVTCPECGLDFDPARGAAERGRYTCPHCGHWETVLAGVKRTGGPLPVRMYGLEYYCPTCDRRGYKRADEQDLALLAQAERRFDRERDRLLFPRQAIPTVGRSDPRPVNHGYTHFKDLFNHRQLLALSWLLQGILQVEDRNVRELLLLAFSDCLDANNMFCKYERDYHKISLLFGLHAYHPIERPTENNVWGTRYGRGTFVRCFQKMRRGKVYGLAPYERAMAGGRSRKVMTGERVWGTLADSFSGLMAGQGNALLRVGSSEVLDFLPDRSVDAVITDPPYFDNVAYAELADFFYVWLRLGLKDDYPWFAPENSWRAGELVQNVRLGKTEATFAAGLGAVWRECHRVLKQDGLLLFTFHHNQVSAWAALTRVLLEAGFVVVAAPVVRSEGKSGFHSDAGNIKYDVCLVCRRRDAGPRRGEWSELCAHACAGARRWQQRLVDGGMELNPGDELTITLGQAMVAYTRHWPEVWLEGRRITPEEALDKAATAGGT